MKEKCFSVRDIIAIRRTYKKGFKSKVILVNGLYYSPLDPVELMNNICIHYGASMRGRTDAAKVMLGSTTMPAFVIRPQDVVAVPVVSPSRPDCVWIFNHSFAVEELSKKSCLLHFKDGTSVEVPCSKYSLLKQNSKMYQLLGLLKNKEDFTFE